MDTSQRLWRVGVAGVLGTVIGGCGADYHAGKVHDGQERADSLTVGKVQRESSKGMTGDKVVEALGSPNIVTTDEQGREVWVYDRYATDVVSSSSSSGIWQILGIGGQSSAAGNSQRTLTVVIKFDGDKRVRDVAYHSS